jgi:hypothetical protein
MAGELPSRRERILTVWPRPTKLLPIIGGKKNLRKVYNSS